MQLERKDTDWLEYMTVEKNLDKKRYNMPHPLGHISHEEESVSRDISILQSTYKMTDDLYLSGSGKEPLLELQFNLSEENIHYENRKKHSCVALARSGNLQYLPAEENFAKILFRKNTCYRTFDIHLPITFLNKYAGNTAMMDTFLETVHRGQSGFMLPQQVAINADMYHVMHNILHCRYEGLTKKIYLEAQVYELVALLYAHSNDDTKTQLCEYDIQKIHDAAAMIRENLESPLTIVALAKTVGINQTKLKKGFKDIHGTTVFGYLQQIRMTHAKKYLLDTDKSIQEISMLLGYRNIANFSNAFKRMEGCAPFAMRNPTSKKGNIYL